MSSIAITTHELDRNLKSARRAAQKGPVFVTEQGKTCLVLLSVSDYVKISSTFRIIAGLTAMSGAKEVALEVPSSSNSFQMRRAGRPRSASPRASTALSVQEVSPSTPRSLRARRCQTPKK